MSADVRAAWAAAERLRDFAEELPQPGGSGPMDADAAERTAADITAVIAVADAACACGGEHVCERDVAAARAAIRVLLEEHHLADFVYNVRQRAAEGGQSFQGNSWEHPKVRSFAGAVETLRAFAKGGAATKIAPCPLCGGFGMHLHGCLGHL